MFKGRESERVSKCPELTCEPRVPSSFIVAKSGRSLVPGSLLCGADVTALQRLDIAMHLQSAMYFFVWGCICGDD